jgi:hypothetical protein
MMPGCRFKGALPPEKPGPRVWSRSPPRRRSPIPRSHSRGPSRERSHLRWWSWRARGSWRERWPARHHWSNGPRRFRFFRNIVRSANAGKDGSALYVQSEQGSQQVHPVAIHSGEKTWKLHTRGIRSERLPDLEDRPIDDLERRAASTARPASLGEENRAHALQQKDAGGGQASAEPAPDADRAEAGDEPQNIGGRHANRPV